MSAKIYSAPEELEIPKFDFANFNAKLHQEKEDKYIADLKQYLHDQGYTEKNTGEVIKFPAGDGYALYMVASMKPLMLIHLELGDAWSFQYVNLLTAKEVQEKIDQQKALDKLFSNNKKSKEA